MKSKSRILAIITILTFVFVMICAVACQHQHDPNSIYRNDEEYHWFVCNKCGEELEKEEHIFGKDNVCTKCHTAKTTTGGKGVDLVINDKDKYKWRTTERPYDEVLQFDWVSEDSFYLKVTGLKEGAVQKDENDKDIPLVIDIPDRAGSNGMVPVTAIDKNAFKNSTSIIQVTIPDSVTTIGESAFEGCTNLVRVKLPSSATYGRNVFQDCSNLDFVEFGTIKQQSVYDPYYEEFTTVPPTIPEYMFNNCIRLHKIVIPDEVTEIAFGAFAGCVSLEEIVIGTNVKKIQGGAFLSDTNLKRVYYKGTSKSIWDKSVSIVSDGNTPLVQASKAFYSKNKPTAAGTYWHYTSENLIELW